MSHLEQHLLAVILHESGRAPVAAGQTLAHAVQSPAERPFVEWADLPEHVQRGRRMTAGHLLERYDVGGEPLPDLGTCPTSVDDLAQAIHECEYFAVTAGLVLVKLDRPWIRFSELPEVAKDGRRRQAAYLLARAWWMPRRT